MSSLSPDDATDKSGFFESGDWDRYWEDEGKQERGIQKIISKFRKHFDDQYIKQLITLPVPSQGKILEVGCGTAYSTQKLGGAKGNCYALDYSVSAKLFWNRKLAHFFVADGFHLPFKSDSFDLVWNAGVIEHFPNPGDMLNEMIRVCKPGGYICVFVPYIFDITAHLKLYGEENIFTKKKLKAALLGLEDVGIKVLYKCGGMIICGWGRKGKV